MTTILIAAGLAIGTLVGATGAQAVTYNLTNDFSSTSNPNGPWSIVYNNAALPHQTGTTTANALNPAVPGAGFFGTGTDFNNDVPFVLKAAVNGSAAGETDLDFLAGDIIIHSPNDGTALSIVWTAPSAGTVSNFFAAAWYAHSIVDRSNEAILTLPGAAPDDLGPISKTFGFNRNAANTYSPSDFTVNAGDLITLSFLKTVGQASGSLNGTQLSFDFTPSAVTPIPATLPLFASGLIGLGWFGHRRRKQAA